MLLTAGRARVTSKGGFSTPFICKMAAGDRAGDSDCMWVVERSKAFLSANEKHAARAWMLTARSLYPHQFIVQACSLKLWNYKSFLIINSLLQYEAFCLYVLCEEFATAANTLTELYVKLFSCLFCAY